MKRKIIILVVVTIFFISFSTKGRAINKISKNHSKVESIADKKTLSDICYLTLDKEQYTSNNILTYSSSRVLWNQRYTNQGSVKKTINTRSYSPFGNAGRVTVTIRNTGRTTMKINIYQSWRNSNTLASGSISPGSSRTFVIGPEKGRHDCRSNNCYYYHNFTISAYANSGTISFTGYAKITY